MPDAPDLPIPDRPWRITVLPDGAEFAAAATDTVLLAALQAGVDWPSSCRNGTCRTCMGYITQGQVRYLIEWPGLSAEEKAEGFFLPCVACAASDLEIQPLSL